MTLLLSGIVLLLTLVVFETSLPRGAKKHRFVCAELEPFLLWPSVRGALHFLHDPHRFSRAAFRRGLQKLAHSH